MKLSSRFIEDIRALGLHIDSEPFFGADHRAFPNGYLVIKPSNTRGNHVPGLKASFRNWLGIEDTSDAPVVYVHFQGAEWQYEVSEYVPGPGPGDFRRSACNEHELLERLKKYFFEPNADFEATKSRNGNKEPGSI